MTLCADFEAKNDKLLRCLELWQKILDENLPERPVRPRDDLQVLREKQKDLGKKVETRLDYGRLLELRKSGRMPSHNWVGFSGSATPSRSAGHESRWSVNRVQGAMYDDLVNYALFLGSVRILRWLMEEKGCELNKDTSKWARLGGSGEVLEYLEGRG